MVTYEFYKDVYFGSSIPEADWPLFSARALEQLNKYKRMYTVSPMPGMVEDDGEVNCENMAICAMADAIAYFSEAQSGAGTVSSASVGSVSVSYGNTANVVDLSPKGQAKELYRCASQYLDIYRGVGR